VRNRFTQYGVGRHCFTVDISHTGHSMKDSLDEHVEYELKSFDILVERLTELQDRRIQGKLNDQEYYILYNDERLMVSIFANAGESA